MKCINPMPGRRKPLLIAGLFQVHPEDIAGLIYGSVNSAVKEAGYESLLKTKTKIEAGEQKVTPKFILTVKELSGGKLRYFDEALDGDIEAIKKISDMPTWEAFDLGFRYLDEPISYQASFMIALERESHEAVRLIRAEQHQAALDCLLSAPISRLFLWASATKGMKAIQNKKDWMPYIFSIALETGLSFIAAMDAARCHKLSLQQSMIADVLPTSSTGNHNPISILFHWACRAANLQGPSELWQALNPYDFPDLSFAKRWSAGTHMPSMDNFLLVCQQLNIPCDEANASASVRYIGTKCLNYLGYHAQTFTKLVGSAGFGRIGPWPHFPFECETLVNWFEQRYPCWYDYHRQQLNTQGLGIQSQT